MTVRGLVFDFDGLLVDTESSALQAWEQLLADRQIPFPVDVWRSSIGQQTAQPRMLDHCARFIGAVAAGQLLVDWRAHHDLLVCQSVLRDGVLDYLEEAARTGLRLAVASSASAGWIDRHLRGFGIRSYFDAVCTAAAGVRPKPAPDTYLAALSLLQLPADSAVAFEDSPHGVAAAQAAGLWCVAVPNPVTRNLSLGAADLVVDSMADLPLRHLLVLAAGPEASEQP